MLPFPRISQYGNIVVPRYKIDYDFNANTSNGSINATWTGGSFGTIPAVPSNTYGYTRGAAAGTLSTSFTIGSSDCIIEATYYCASNVNNGYGSIASFGALGSGTLTGFQYSDAGYAWRLAGFFGYASGNSVHSIPYTRPSDYQKVIKIKIERKSGIEKIYLNDVQQAFSLGTSTSYTNTSIENTANIGNLTTINVGSSVCYLARIIIDF